MSNDLLRDLQKLSGAIDRHKGAGPQPSSSRPQNYQSRSYTYTSPSYQSTPKTWNNFRPPVTQDNRTPHPSTTKSKDVTIGGVEFKASKNKLTRKDAPVTSQSLHQVIIRPQKTTSIWNPKKKYPPKSFHSTHRGVYKPRGSRSAPNRVLKNTGRHLKVRKVDKQCPFFTKTGTCSRGKKCPYQHDPDKVAICPRFLHDDCPFTAESCQLSHDPTPNRTPLCIHFANSGRCKNGDKCVYPHFKLAPRTGVCKDFAVLGYCEKGIDCEKQHLKECPGFAENGVCNIKKCKLPHVIRANASRQKKVEKATVTTTSKEDKPARFGISFTTMAPEVTPAVDSSTGNESIGREDAEYIPLTFEESDDESEPSETELDDDEDEDASGEDADPIPDA